MHTFSDPMTYAERMFGRRLAVVCGDVRLTYAEVADRSRRLIGALDSLGLESGDRVAILSANSHQYIEYYQAVPAGGYVIVPLNTRHAAPELRYALEDAGAKVLLTDRDVGDLSECVQHVIRLDTEYEGLIAGATPRDFATDAHEDSLAGLFYTGGTTGASKGVMLSHRNLIANTFHSMKLLELDQDSVYMVMAPLFHAAGSNSVLACTWTGGVQVAVPAFTAEETLDLVARERVTDTLGVPTMMAAMAELQLTEPRDVSSLRSFAHGGSPIATEVVRRSHQAFPEAELVHLYGATETAPLATCLRHEERVLESERARSCGQPVPGVDVRIFNDAGDEVPTGEVGEVAIRGANVMRGYWNKPEQSAEVLRAGWYYSGDLGFADDEGYVFLVDRKKDMIVTGGENVYSTEVEDVLYRHPGVLEAAVFGVPDPQWGEAVLAVVVARDASAPVAAEDLVKFCRESLAGYKVPKRIEVQAAELPKSGPGKILKRELRAPYWEGRSESIS
ncbi:MAG: long-chain-fatty-acid--CoA ligase [Gammaproteobacteria bacterium]|nr:long-chain-fatty-acid--CoA ligase [Gammaproteobacteria bacterium]